MYTSDDSSIIMMPRPGRHPGYSFCTLLFWMNKILILRRNCRFFRPSNFFKSMWFMPSDIWIALGFKRHACHLHCLIKCMSLTLQLHLIHEVYSTQYDPTHWCTWIQKIGMSFTPFNKIHVLHTIWYSKWVSVAQCCKSFIPPSLKCTCSDRWIIKQWLVSYQEKVWNCSALGFYIFFSQLLVWTLKSPTVFFFFLITNSKDHLRTGLNV